MCVWGECFSDEVSHVLFSFLLCVWLFLLVTNVFVLVCLGVTVGFHAASVSEMTPCIYYTSREAVLVE